MDNKTIDTTAVKLDWDWFDNDAMSLWLSRSIGFQSFTSKGTEYLYFINMTDILIFLCIY